MDYMQKSVESVHNFITSMCNQPWNVNSMRVNWRKGSLNLWLYPLQQKHSSTNCWERPKEHVCVCELTDTIAEGRHFEAILTGPQKNQKWTSTPLNNMDQVEQACGNCGKAHPPRTCPAYKDSCKVCGKITHWKSFCWKRKGTNCLKEDCKQHNDIDRGSWRRD